MKLQEIAPYIPYGLNIKILNHKCDYVGIEYSKANGFYFIGNSLHVTYEGGSTGKDINSFKPILRPMSDLNPDELLLIVDHIFRDSKAIRPKPGSVKVDKGYITFYDLNTMQTYVAVKPSQDGTPLLNMSNCFDDYSIFFKLHVDMFNLLSSSLAIDINTVPEILKG